MVKKTIFKERGRSMSRKNHEMIDGKLLQTDKKYSQLKLKQKEKIADWMFQDEQPYSFIDIYKNFHFRLEEKLFFCAF